MARYRARSEMMYPAVPNTEEKRPISASHTEGVKLSVNSFRTMFGGTLSPESSCD